MPRSKKEGEMNFKEAEEVYREDSERQVSNKIFYFSWYTILYVSGDSTFIYLIM